MSMTTGNALPEEISTARLTLRPFRFSDVPEVFAYLQAPDMGRFLEGAASPPTETETAAIIARHILADRTQRNVWAITIGNLPVGGISINFGKEHRVAELGYSIKQALWEQGLASEAARAVVDAAFAGCPDLARIQANIHPGNAASIRVAERLGMVHEGTLRSYAFVANQAADEAVYAVIRDEWRADEGRPG